MERVRSREELLRLLPRDSVGAELGILDGEFSAKIVEIARPRRLFLVDLFTGTTLLMRRDDSGQWRPFHPSPQEAWEMARRRLAEPIERGTVQLICAEACAWLESVPPRSLDWVYLDDDHTYEHVAQELELAALCLKPGGWLMGHDYCEVLPDVPRAVDEFCARHNLVIDVLTDEPLLPVYPRPPGFPPECAYNSFAIRIR